MTTASTNTNEEARNPRADRHMGERHARGKDADGVVSHYAPDNVKFILAPPLQYTAMIIRSIRKAWKQWFSSFQGPDRVRKSRPQYHGRRRRRLLPQALNRMMATTTKGDKVDLWFRRDPRLSQDRRPVEDHP